jgi:hypothetical protein
MNKMYKRLSYLVVLILSIYVYLNIFSLPFYIFEVLLTAILFYFNLEFILRFKKLTLIRKILSILLLVLSILTVYIFYNLSNNAMSVCTQDFKVQVRNYFTGEITTRSSCDIPWYTERLPNQTNPIFNR